MYPEEFLRIKILCPPPEEQRAIVEVVSKNSSKARRAIELAQSELSLFREYRTRLIADVVTGKLDVRDAAEHLPEVDPIAGGNQVGTIQAESNAHAIEYDMAKEAIS